MAGMDQTDGGSFTDGETLPDPLPADPMPVVASWLDEARAGRVQRNPNAMTLATADADGAPSARTVLCKGIDAAAGFVVFYTNYASRKSRALGATGRAALLFHWDALERQARIEGPAVRSPQRESDAYFASRPLISRLGAWASEQSTPIASREAMLDRVQETIARFNVPLEALADPDSKFEIPRPPHWGGWRVFAQRVELWVAGTGRLHDRAEWVRTLRRADEHTYAPGGPWSATRVQP